MRKLKSVLFVALSVGVLLSGTLVANADPPKPGSDPDTPLAHVPADKRAAMAAQDKARAAAGRIRSIVDNGPQGGFTGIELHEGAVRLWYKGALPVAVRSAVEAARGTAPVEVLPAEHSLTELLAASARMVHHLRSHPGGPAHRVSVPVDGSGLVVGVDTAAVASSPASLPDVGVPVHAVAQDRVHQRAGRYDDFAPFYGGGSIISGDRKTCSAGFGVRYGTQQYLLTAGHCGFPGQTWSNGNGSRAVGTVTNENVGQDLLLIAASAGSHVFTGFGTSSNIAHVYAWDWVYTGEELCSSAAATTWLCGHVVIDAGNTSYCGYDMYGNWECYSGMVWSRQEDGAQAARNGDSGGPVVLPTTSGIVAKGVLSGAGGSDLIWQDFATAAQIWGITPVT